MLKKITDFIVEKRYFFLIIFILLSGLCLFLSTKVTINDDIMKYLPKSSETKIGKDIMDEEFLEQDTSTLNVMLKDLSKKEKQEAVKKLEKIEGVTSVEYEDTEEYNKKNASLYILTVDDYADSKTATNVYETVKKNFKKVEMNGTIYEENKPILQLWIVILAIACAMVILIILSDSYIEPWLYLLSIGIAVFINKGTNIIFPSVSSITDSITAILQLALSMDYSIMLSNRYKQEKEKQKDKKKAMKEALYHSFKAISSSSVTTIVGLLALVFMSFTIGKDLGFVLAKGVLLSLISIFFCLPALLLIFDDLIAKTKKKSLNFNLTKLGSFIYKTRYLQAILIILMFIGSYLTKGNIGILYTGSEQDEVGKVFPATNQVAIVYENQYEEIIKNYCQKLEQDEKIDQVLCYSNTINEKLAHDELKNKLKDLGQEVDIEDYLIKTIYYKYYNQEEKNEMTLEEFISFIKSDIETNKELEKKLDNETKENIDRLENFTEEDLINKKRSKEDIASILGITEEEAESILILYHSKNKETTMTLNEFIDFMLKEIRNNKTYSNQLDQKTIEQLTQLEPFTEKDIIEKQMTPKELSNLFGVDENLVEELFLLYDTTKESTTTMTLKDFATFASSLSEDPQFSSYFGEEEKALLPLLLKLTSDEVVQKETSTEMTNTLKEFHLEVEEETINLLYKVYAGYRGEDTLTIVEFAEEALTLADTPQYERYFTKEMKKELNSIGQLKYFYQMAIMSPMFFNSTISPDAIEIIHEKGVALDTSKTPEQWIVEILENQELVSTLQRECPKDLETLLKANFIMNNFETRYTSRELAEALSIDPIMASVVYGEKEKGNENAFSLQEIIIFLYENKENALLKEQLSNLPSNQLSLAYQGIINRNNPLSYQETAIILGMEKEKTKQIYGVYDYMVEDKKMTPNAFASFIINNQDNENLKGRISKEKLSKLMLVKEVMQKTIAEEKLSASTLSSLLGVEEETLNLVFGLYQVTKNPTNLSLYEEVDFLVKEVMTNNELSKNFSEEKKNKLETIYEIMQNKNKKQTSKDLYKELSKLEGNIDKTEIELVYLYYGSKKEYNDSWKMTIEEFVSYLNSDILKDKRMDDFINQERRKTIKESKETINKSKGLLVSDKYSRVVLNTKYKAENKETYNFINQLKKDLGNKKGIYIVGNSPMAVEMSKTFNQELNKITILTMIFIFLVVAFTFKDFLIPLFLVLIIQTAVYLTMSAITLTGGSVYFISLLIVQAILMGATIDYAIVYTSYYKESRQTMGRKEAIINAYNKSIHTILSSSLILMIVTLVVAGYASAIAAKICETISQGTFASVLLILFLLPGVLATTDKWIIKDGYQEKIK